MKKQSKPFLFFTLTLAGSVLTSMLSGGNSLAITAQEASEQASPTLPRRIAQANPLYMCRRLTHSVGGIVYQSTVVMNGYIGAMRTSYWSPLTSRTETVDQTMRVVSSSSGPMISGSNPVFAGTNVRAVNYSPDHFIFAIQPNGQYIARTCDERLACSPVDVRYCS
jgi:hypothetical protein